MILAVPIAAALRHGNLPAATVVLAIAAASDALDGFLARRYGWRSEMGAVLDPIADKVLFAAVFIALALRGWTPPWLMAAVLIRDAVIVGGAIAYRVWLGPLQARASLVSKLNTLCQAAYLLSVVARVQLLIPPLWMITALGALLFACTVVSGIDYVLVYGRRARTVAAAA